MKTLSLDKDKLAIAQRIRLLRQERRWTQVQLAKLLGLSQNRLSELERGQGSFSAEQLLAVLATFNVPVDYFSTAKKSEVDQLQNTLARLGASHLMETEALPSEQVKDALDAIRETLVSADNARHIAALAPVIVNNIQSLNLSKLQAQLAELGHERRLAWVIDNIWEAIKHELHGDVPDNTKLAYERVRVRLRPIRLQQWSISKNTPEDILDPEIASEKSIEEIRKESSSISKQWRILTGIQVADFVRALEAAR